MINRLLQSQISANLFKGKAILLYGPRQVGKTTMILEILNEYRGSSILLNGDDPTVRRLLDSPNTEQLRQIIGENRIVFVDEAQQIVDIGRTAKLMVDIFRDVQLILSGSSSFDLASATQEPLTGRKITCFLFPVSWAEWQHHSGYLTAEQDMETRLVYGFYPEVLVNNLRQELVLREIADSYLYKDVLLYGNLKKPDEIRNLLQAIAFQVGSEVSYSELGEITGLDPKTVERYISILEKAFVIFRLGSFSRNLRNEIRKGRKIYFYDNGIRNAVTGQFQPFSLRQDTGALWENFVISERKKRNAYNQYFANAYFWRTSQQQEIDYIEEINGTLTAFEIKFNEKKRVRIPKTFTNTYETSVKVVNRSNFREFIL